MTPVWRRSTAAALALAVGTTHVTASADGGSDDAAAQRTDEAGDPSEPAVGEAAGAPADAAEAAEDAGEPSDALAAETDDADAAAEETDVAAGPSDTAGGEAGGEPTDGAAVPEDTAQGRDAADPRGMWAVRVRISGGAPGELELFRLDPMGKGKAVGSMGGVPYNRLCRDPCETRVGVDPGDRLFVAGANVMPSKPFSLDGASEVELRVRPGPKAIRFAGFGLTVSGALLVPAGGLLVGAVGKGPGPDIAGFTLIGVGVVSLAVGIGLLIRGRTLVDVH